MSNFIVDIIAQKFHESTIFIIMTTFPNRFSGLIFSWSNIDSEWDYVKVVGLINNNAGSGSEVRPLLFTSRALGA